MKRWQITFIGKKIGSVHAAFPDRVTRYVNAETQAQARLMAYDTHEHILGGADSVGAIEIVCEVHARDNDGRCHICGAEVSE